MKLRNPQTLSNFVQLSLVAALVTAPVAAQSVAQTSGSQGFLPQVVTDWFAVVDLVPWIAGVISVAAIFLFVTYKLRLRRREIRREILGLPNGSRFRVVDAMAHCVRRGRSIDGERLKRALEVARNTTNMDYTADHIREAAMRADCVIVPVNFLYMGEGLTHPERLLVFNSAVSVLLADGPLAKADRMLLKHLAFGLRLRRQDLRDLRHLIPA